MFRKKFFEQGPKFEQKSQAIFQILLRNGAVMHHTFKEKGLRDIKNGMSMTLDTGKAAFENQQ